MQNINWEKIGIYLAVLTIIFGLNSNIADLRERIAKAEVEILNLKDRIIKTMDYSGQSAAPRSVE